MKRSLTLLRQRGATLVIGLIMLALITLTVTTAFTLSNTNLKAVGNMQFRSEAMAAANKAIEEIVSTPFTNNPAAAEISVDINNDSKVDYLVQVSRPTCARSVELVEGAGPGEGSSTELNLPTPTPNYNTIWNIEAQVTDANSGASIRVHQGVRVVLTQAQQAAVCV